MSQPRGMHQPGMHSMNSSPGLRAQVPHQFLSAQVGCPLLSSSSCFLPNKKQNEKNTSKYLSCWYRYFLWCPMRVIVIAILLVSFSCLFGSHGNLLSG